MKGRILQLLLALACMGATPTVVLAEHGPRQFLKQGMSDFQEGLFTNAVTAFSAAAETTDRETLDPAVPLYNLGLALANAHRPEEALDAFREAQQTEDLRLQSRARYSEGTLLYQQANELLQQGEAQPAKEAAEAARLAFQRAILLDPTDEDAKVNYELAHRFLFTLERAVQQAEQLIEQARKLVQERNYQGAADLLESNAQIFLFVGALRPELATKHQHMIQSSRTVFGILESEVPEAPTPGDPVQS